LASKRSALLRMGKHKATRYAVHSIRAIMIVVNCANVKMTGHKERTRNGTAAIGLTRGDDRDKASTVLRRGRLDGERSDFRNAAGRRSGKKMYRKLQVYAGPSTPTRRAEAVRHSRVYRKARRFDEWRSTTSRNRPAQRAGRDISAVRARARSRSTDRTFEN